MKPTSTSSRPPLPADTVAAQLRELLDHELTIHRQLLQLAEEKQRAVIQADGKALQHVVDRESAPMFEAGRARQTRERLLRTAAALWNISGPATTLSKICERLPEELRAEIMRRGHDVRGVVERLRAVNDRNQMLIRHGLGLVREMVTAVTGAPASNGYDRRGMAPGTGGQSGFLLNVRT